MKTSCRAVWFVASLVLSVFQAGAGAHTDVTPEQARELIESTENLLVVDVREPSEYCDVRGHIPGAVNYPLSSGVLYARYDELPMDRPILVVCRSGGRSNQAANFLDSQGFPEIYDMTGGMNAWQWETVPCKYAGGSGTAADPYQIATAADLIALGETPDDYDKHFILTADIDLDPNLPGGRVFERTVIPMLHGVLDGADHIITHLTIRAPERYAGLFGRLATTATVRDLELVDIDIVGSANLVGGLVGDNAGTLINCSSAGRISGHDYVGGLAGDSSGTLVDCHTRGTVSGLDYAGGLAGHSYQGPVKNSSSTSQVTGHSSVGGLIGRSTSDVTGCHSSGVVIGSGWQVGGLVGTNAGGAIGESYSTSDVTGHSWVGGLVGEHDTGMILDCHTVGAVVGNDFVGGLVGVNRSTVIRCYASGDVTGRSFVGGLVGVNGDLVTHCWSSGAVEGDANVGGLVGNNSGHAVSDSYSAGSVSGRESVGGLVGYNEGSVANSYSAGAVLVAEDTERFGALIGRGSGSVEGCFWDEETSGPIGSAGGQGRTTSQMQIADTYLEAGWDFVGETENGTDDIWKIAEGLGYPHLWWEKYGGGTGEPNDPYRIYTAEQLNAIGADPDDYDKHFKLMADIDLAGYSYDRAVIAPDTNDTDPSFQGTPFTGVFDGGGRTIASLTIVCRDTRPGLFGWLGAEARVTDLRIVDVNITDVHMGMAGMLAAQTDGLVANIYARGTLSAGSEVGGLVGSNGGSVIACCTAGSIDAIKAVGGLVGRNQGTVENSCSIAAVGGRVMVAGLVGDNDAGSVSYSYSAGPVTNTALDVGPDEPQGMGGLVGRNRGHVTDSFWDVETSGLSISDGGNGRNTGAMQTAGTYLNVGWDFIGEVENGTEEIWWIEEGQDYPRLWWETADAEF